MGHSLAANVAQLNAIWDREMGSPTPSIFDCRRGMTIWLLDYYASLLVCDWEWLYINPPAANEHYSEKKNQKKLPVFILYLYSISLMDNCKMPIGLVLLHR
jgi:hypothetical protein